MRANQARYCTATMARVLGVSPSGFYAWRDREPSRRRQCEVVLKACIGNIHQRSRGAYGAPRIHAELAADGVDVARKRVAPLMREMGLAGISRRKGTRTTRRDDTARRAPDLVERRFEAAHSGESDHRFRREADHRIRSTRSLVGAKRRGCWP